jgi:hypothetical protein
MRTVLIVLGFLTCVIGAVTFVASLSTGGPNDGIVAGLGFGSFVSGILLIGFGTVIGLLSRIAENTTPLALKPTGSTTQLPPKTEIPWESLKPPKPPEYKTESEKP